MTDPELGHPVDWGIDLFGGYGHVGPVQGDFDGWIRHELEVTRCDLFIVNGYVRTSHRIAARAARDAGVKTALRLDSAFLPGVPRRLAAKRALYKFKLMPLFDLFLGVGTLSREYLAACGVPEGRVGLFPYAIDVEAFRQQAAAASIERAARRRAWGVPEDAWVIASVAKHAPRESPRDLLAAAEHLPQDAWIVLAGDGPERPALERLAAARGLERVRFLGYVAYPELPSLYAASDVFVHTAREERWGVSVAEALACGLPVVAADTVGAGRDLVMADENGAIYPTGDAVRLAESLAAVRRLPVERVRNRNREILARWDYAATLDHLVQAAARGRSTAERS